MMGTTDAETMSTRALSIQSTSGSVTVGSTANTTATATAQRHSERLRPRQPERHRGRAGHRRGQPNGAGHDLERRDHRAADNVNLTASGNGSNTSQPSTTTYVSGIAGVAVGVNITENTIKAYDDGTTSSGAATVASQLQLDPINDVDFAKSAFRVPAAEMNGLQTRQPYVYSSGDNGAIGGLVSGYTYYIIVPTDLTNEIQLAATSQDAENGYSSTSSSIPP